jgi:hypothetical protein
MLIASTKDAAIIRLLFDALREDKTVRRRPNLDARDLILQIEFLCKRALSPAGEASSSRDQSEKPPKLGRRRRAS